MNERLQKFARQTLKDGLVQLPENNQRIFKLMYARDDGRRTVDEATAMPINDVVDQMPAEKLDWAMQQVERTLTKVRKQSA